MREELHLFIIWENARDKQNEIIEDIKKNFKILNIYEMKWDKEHFSNNLSRFYGTNLPKGSGKETHCGTGEFLLIIVKDTNPIYEERQTSKGGKTVNTNMFDKKEQYRKLTGGGHKIHATNDEKETNHDITLLLGKNIEDYIKENNSEWDGKIIQKNNNLIGFQEWKSVSQMFYALNNCIEYAILRNYEALPDEIYENDHNDIDIICKSLEDVAYVLNAVPEFKEEYRVHYKTKVEGKIAYFDLRHIGDNYYYEKIEERILANKIYNPKGFYTVNQEDYFYTLLYHALIQKKEFKNDYKEKLKKLDLEKRIDENTTEKQYVEILKKWLKENDYIITYPIDKSVIMNDDILKYFEPVLYRGEIKEKDIEIESLKEENNRLEIEKNQLITELEAIKDSRTWKIMNPIRKIKKVIKKN